MEGLSRRVLATALVLLSCGLFAAPLRATDVEKHVLCAGTPWATELYVLRGPAPGPSVMVIGGLHGTEDSGWLTAEQFLSKKLANGTLVVVPRANRPAIKRHVRYTTHDLNHSFPGSPKGGGESRLAYEIMQAVGTYHCQLVLGLHQGHGVHSRDSRRVGQTLITGIPRAKDDFPWRVVDKVNAHISNRADHFTVDIYPVDGSSSEESVRKYHNRAFALESSDTYPLAKRIEYLRLLVDGCLSEVGMRYATAPAPTASVPPHLPMRARASLKARSRD